MTRPLTVMRSATGRAAIVTVVSLLATALVSFWLFGSDASEDGVVPLRESEDRSGNLVQAVGEPGEPADFYTVKAHGFDKAPEALAAGQELMPFSAPVPSYIPSGLSLWLVHSVTDASGARGNFEVAFMAGPGDTPQPSLRIIMRTGKGPEDLTPELHTPSGNGTFITGGLSWSYFRMQWRDFATYEARALTPDGRYVFLELRIVGMTDDEALSELQRVAESLNLA